MKILVFAPHSAIWAHAFPEALAVEALAQHGHDIVYIACGRIFRKECICMLASGVYCWNDVADRVADRNHPIKRNRPIARGTISVIHHRAMSRATARV